MVPKIQKCFLNRKKVLFKNPATRHIKRSMSLESWLAVLCQNKTEHLIRQCTFHYLSSDWATIKQSTNQSYIRSTDRFPFLWEVTSYTKSVHVQWVYSMYIQCVFDIYSMFNNIPVI